MEKEKKIIKEEATFGAGCFWHVEDEFINTKGVIDTKVGFMGGDIENPSYERVCEGDTGHAEVVHVTFDTEKISYEEILQTFFHLHDPTQIDAQGSDFGTQYRSVIFYHSPRQRELAENMKSDLDESGEYSERIATEIAPAETFYPAEEYHQRYIEKNGGGVCNV